MAAPVQKLPREPTSISGCRASGPLAGGAPPTMAAACVQRITRVIGRSKRRMVSDQPRRAVLVNAGQKRRAHGAVLAGGRPIPALLVQGPFMRIALPRAMLAVLSLAVAVCIWVMLVPSRAEDVHGTCLSPDQR